MTAPTTVAEQIARIDLELATLRDFSDRIRRGDEAGDRNAIHQEELDALCAALTSIRDRLTELVP